MTQGEQIPGSGDVFEGRHLPDAAWARQIGRLGDEQLASGLKGLPVERQVELALAVGWHDRVRIIRNSEEGAEIVKALPPEEVFLTMKGVEEEAALALFELTTPDQLRLILDLELWKDDRIDEDRVVTWLKHMLACGESKIIDFVKTADLELLTLVMRKLVYLVPNEEGATIPEELPSIMPDEFFTIFSNIPEETESVGLFLRIIRQADRDFFYKMLFLVNGAIEDESQEEALRWRRSRLEEIGLLDFDEAVEIYGYIGEEEARRIGGVVPRYSRGAEVMEQPAPTFPVLMNEKRTFFFELLRSIEDGSLRERLQREIAFSANRLLVADAEHIGDLDSMKKALARLFSLANVGLLFLAGGDRDESLRVLRDVSLREVFQIGFSRVADLRSQAAEIARKYWPEWRTRGFGFLEPPSDEILRGLLMRVPQYYEFGRPGAGFRDFETLDEVRDARMAVEEIRVTAEMCFEKLGLPRPHEAKPALAAIFATGLEDITLRNLVMTGFVNLILRGSFEIEPLSRDDLPGLFDKIFETGAAGRRVVKPESRERLTDWLSQVTGFDAAKRPLLEKFAEAGIKGLEEEIGGVPAWQDVDPRYVRTLIFRK